MTENPISRSDNGRNTPESVQVSLPCSQDQFAEFLIGLLGRPKNIEQNFSFPYVLKIRDISHIDSLIRQRVNQNDTARIVEFSCVINYTDDTNVTVHSLSELQNYNEPRNVATRSFNISWSVLIKFPNHRFHESQNINIKFMVPTLDQYHNRKYSRSIYEDPGFIRLSIDHTERTWGNDIHNILSTAISNLELREDRYTKFLKKWGPKGLGVFSFATLTSAVFGIVGVIHYYQNQSNAQKSEMLESKTREIIQSHEELHSAVPEIVGLVQSISTHNTAVEKYLFPIFLVLMFLMVGRFYYRDAKSFILKTLSQKSIINFTQRDNDDLESVNKSKGKAIFRVAGGNVAAFIISLIAGYLIAVFYP
jgi:hypothetical protein